MYPPILPVVERAARFALRRRGFVSRMVPTPMGAIHAYDTWGEGSLPTTVVLHGIGSTAMSFAMVMSALKRDVRRIVAPDLPGHGFSEPPRKTLTPEALYSAVSDTLAALVPERMLLVGNSLGGAIALRYAVENRDRVAGLVLVSPAGASMTREEWEELVATFRLESSADARRLLRRLYHRVPWYTPMIASEFRDVMKRRAIRDVLDTASPDDLPKPEQLRALPMPVLLLWGRSERVLPPSSLSYFRQHLPAHAVVEEPVAFGHCPHFEDPGRLAKRIADFGREVVTRRPPWGAADWPKMAGGRTPPR